MQENKVRVPRVTRGLRRGPERIVIYGPEGTGKSTFASEAPAPLFLDLENSTTRLAADTIGDWNDPENLPPQNWQELTTAIWSLVEDKEFRAGKQTLIIETADKLEQSYIHPETLARWPAEEGKAAPQSLDAIGFAKGYTAAMKVWEEFLTLLDSVQVHTQMNIIIVAHARISKVDNLNGVDYSCYEPDLYSGKNTSAAARLREWADAVLFLTFDDAAIAQKARDIAAGKSVKMTTTGNRVVWTSHQGWCEAKNRTELPSKIVLPYGASWQTYDTLVDAYYARKFELNSAPPDSIRKMILHYARRISAWPETPEGWLDTTFMPQMALAIDRERLVKLYQLVVARISNRAKKLISAAEEPKALPNTNQTPDSPSATAENQPNPSTPSSTSEETAS